MEIMGSDLQRSCTDHSADMRRFERHKQSWFLLVVAVDSTYYCQHNIDGTGSAASHAKGK